MKIRNGASLLCDDTVIESRFVIGDFVIAIKFTDDSGKVYPVIPRLCVQDVVYVRCPVPYIRIVAQREGGLLRVEGPQEFFAPDW